MNNMNFIERLKKVANVKEDQELAEIFNMSKANFSYAKKNGSFSFSSIASFAEKYDCDLNWLITGKSKEQEADPVTAMLLAGFNGLTDLQKLQAITFIGNLANNQQETHSTSSISQSSGENGINNAAGGDINIHKDSNQSVDVEPVKKRKKSTWTFIGDNGDLYD